MNVIKCTDVPRVCLAKINDFWGWKSSQDAGPTCCTISIL